MANIIWKLLLNQFSWLLITYNYIRDNKYNGILGMRRESIEQTRMEFLYLLSLTYFITNYL